MKGGDILKLAGDVLTPEEIEACFLAGYHRLEPSEKVVVEESAGVLLFERSLVEDAEVALDTVGRLGIFLATHPIGPEAKK